MPHITTALTESDLNDIKGIVDRAFQAYFKDFHLSAASAEHAEEFFTRNQACKFLQVSTPTLSKLIKEGKLPCHRIGNVLRIKKSALIKSLVVVRTKNFDKAVTGNST
jgi:excisionase family DNA binding protein